MNSKRLNRKISLLLALVLVLTTVTVGPRETKAEPEPAAVTSDFEDGTVQGWFGRGGTEALTATADAAHSGAYGLQVDGRTQGWHGPMLDVTQAMPSGKTYALSSWVRLPEGTPDAPVSMTIQRTAGGTTYYENVGSVTATAGGWTKLAGEYKLNGTPESIAVYFESFSNPTLVFYMDDFRMEATADEPPIEIEKDIPSLKDVFAGDFMLGSSFLVSEIADPDGPHAQLLEKHFNALTAGNELKWDATEPQEGQFDFTRADRAFHFAQASGIAFRGHTLVWHSQTPDWVFYDEKGNLASKELLYERMKRHIETVMGRYKGQIYAWDVVNEVIEPGDNRPNGLRNSLWYQIAGEEYIEKAFEFAHAADPDAKLFINDYNTHQPEKRQFLHDLIKRLQAKGIPVDGVGHQMHINIQYPSAQEIDETIAAFADLGIEQQITELDMSSYTNDTDSWESFPLEQQIRQAYRYKEIFDVFRKYNDLITAVIFWGKDDANSWLRTFPVVRNNWPLLFDERLQAKYAYWALVDPSKVPVEIKRATSPSGSAVIDGVKEDAWNRAPAVSIVKDGEAAAEIKTLWDESNLYVSIDVFDRTTNGNDAVEIFVDGNNGKTSAYEADDAKYTLRRSGANPHKPVDYKAVNTAGGYALEAAIPLGQAELGQEIGFDVRIVDKSGSTETMTSWNDTTGAQDTDTSKFGVLAFVEGPQLTAAAKGTPVVDGSIDDVWEGANEISTERWVAGSSGSTAKVRTLWDEGRLYVLAEVTDSLLSKQSANVYEQDSVEIFIDQNNGATASFEADDGQYRINFDNEQSVNPVSLSANLVSAAQRTADGYIVEASVAWTGTPPKAGDFIGFDVQVNNDEDGDGKRDSVAIWNDRSGQSYRNTSGYGLLQLVEE
ncbi:endo-1,4-beta-xylanase [Paenibacillus thailandensis]|uniref:Beta-xylanase n=1 Tax=Paenibacillus thailandensis TaxID=393250 RepID=A0ABW5R1S8_9BACL